MTDDYDVTFYKKLNEALRTFVEDRGRLIKRLQDKLRRKNRKSAKQHQALSQWKVDWREMQK